MSSYDIRNEARQLLKTLVGKYKLFLFPLLATFLVAGSQVKSTLEYQQQLSEVNNTITTTLPSVSVSSDIFSQLLSFIISVLFISAAYTLLDAYRQKRTETTYQDSLRAFSSPYLFKLFLIFLAQWLLLLPWTLLIVLPAIILGVVTFMTLNTGNQISPTLIGIILILALVGFVMIIIKTYAYSQANLILFDRIEEGGDTNPFDIIKESVQLMKGKKFDLFILRLSFLGWVLLIPLTLGLAAIYVIPYIVAADTVFYDNLKNQKDA